MVSSRRLVPTLLLFLLATVVPLSCKKKADGEAAEVVEQDGGGEKSEKTTDSRKIRKSKGKSKKTRAQAKETEESGDGAESTAESAGARSRSSAKKAKTEEGDGKTTNAATKESKMVPGSATKTAAEVSQGKAEASKGMKGAQPLAEGGVQPAPEAGAAESAVEVPSTPPSRVGVARLLTNTDLNGILPMKGWASHGPVPGISPSEFYNSILYRIPNTSAFASIQVWDFETPSLAIEKWNEVQATYPNLELYTEGFLKDSLYSSRNQVKTFAFLEPKSAIVVAISCFTQACDDSALYQLAELAFTRLQPK